MMKNIAKVFSVCMATALALSVCAFNAFADNPEEDIYKREIPVANGRSVELIIPHGEQSTDTCVWEFEWDVGAMPTCTTAGSGKWTCKTEHDPEVHNDDLPKVIEVKEIPQFQHEPEAKIIKPATCTEEGLLQYVCKYDGAFLNEEAIPPLEHEAGETRVITPPTCTVPGVEGVFCKVCNELIPDTTKAIPATGHDWDEGLVTIEPTCEAEGVKVFTCKNDEAHTKTESIPALGHKWDAGVVKLEPTCEEAGEMLFTCENDASHTKTEAIAAKGHDWGDWVDKDEQWHIRTCKTDSKHIEWANHRYSEWVITKKKTDKEDGACMHVCLDCKHKQTWIMKAGAPETGDEANIALYSVLTLSSAAAMAGAVTVLKKKN